MADKVIVSKSKLTAIANAIRSKTGSTENLTLDNMVTAINNISGGSTNTLKKLLDTTKSGNYLFDNYQGISVYYLISYSDTENVIEMKNMFSKCNNLTTIPLLNTSNVSTMNQMFYNCKKLQTIPQLDTSNVTDMGYMFYACTKLQTIPQLNTSNVTNMTNMFYGCNELESIPQLDTSNVTNMVNMFNGCYNLQTIDITSMDKITSTSNSSSMCRSCYSLTKLIIRTMTVIPPLNTNSFTNCYHFEGKTNSTYNPTGAKDGRIYVPDNMVETLKSATNWSVYADIIVPLSTLVEE